MIDLNEIFRDKSLLKSLLAFCVNYTKRVEYLERENLIREEKRKGIEKNYRNAQKIIPMLEEIINE